MKFNKRIDFEEREIIEFCLSADVPYYLIAHKLGRSLGTLRQEIMRNGGKVNYSAKKAEERAKNCKLKSTETGRENLKQAAKKKTLPFKTKNSRRLSNLEFQVEIILETIKELKEKLC